MDLDRQNISSGAIWEDKVGYSRAVRIGNQLEISGCVATKDGKTIGKGDAYLQAKRCFEIILEALNAAGATPQQVIRTRMYVTDINRDWEAVGRAHAEVFAQVKPSTTMVEVSALIHQDYLVEIEATAVLSS